MAQDIDPKESRDDIIKARTDDLKNTFGELAKKWLVLKKQQVKPETAEKAYQSLIKHILPKLENVPVDIIKPKLIIDILEPVKNNGSLETVKRLCRVINEVMLLAVASGIIEVNYLSDVTKLFPAPKKTNMRTLTPDRLPELMNALSMASIKRQTRCLIEWQLHTMTRPIEAVSAKWEEIDLDKKVWVIPAEKMKMKKAHTIPLTDQTISLLEVIKSISFSDVWLFSGFRVLGDN